MVVEISEEDFKAIEEAIGNIKASVVEIRMGSERDRGNHLQNINYQANSIINLLHNGILEEKEREVEARR